MPRVSFVMSCHNAAPWLSRSLPSMAAQTWRDLEMVLVDDGSTDSTAALLRDFADRDDRVRLIHKPNTGLADSLNVGIAAARGEWIARLDADDWCAPERISLQMRAAEADPRGVYVGSGSQLVDARGRALQAYEFPRDGRALRDNLMHFRRFPAHSSALLRRSSFDQVGGYRPRIARAEDYDLWLRLSEVGHLTSVPQPLVSITSHAEQVSRHNQGLSQWADSLVALSAHFVRQLGGSDPIDGAPARFEAFRQAVTRHDEAVRLQRDFLGRTAMADAGRGARGGHRWRAMHHAWRQSAPCRPLWHALWAALGPDGRTRWARTCAQQWRAQEAAGD